MKVKRTTKISVSKKHKDYDYLIQQMAYSKSIYNYINFLIRQLFFKNTKEDFIFKDEILTEYPTLITDLENYFSHSTLLSSTVLTRIARNYSKEVNFNINSKVVTSTVRKLFSDWKSFFSLLKLKQEGKYNEKINIPKYKKKDYNLVEYNSQTISKTLKKEKGLLGTVQMSGIKLPYFIDIDDVSSFRVYMKHSSLIVEVVYEKDVNEYNDAVNNFRVCGADPGLDVLLALSFNYNKRPLNVNGKNLKSINQYFNKEISRLKSQLPKGVYTSKRIDRLYSKRERQIRNYLGQVTNKLTNLLKEENIDTFIIGRNKKQKQNINIGKSNNQNFVYIPYDKLRNILKYKLEEAGIKYVEQEESYTSKASFLDNDNIPTYNGDSDIKYTFSGKRVKRGLYKSKEGKLIHADTNGSLNILRKAQISVPQDLPILKRNLITPLQLV